MTGAVRKQSNKESVARKAIEHLGEEMPAPDTSGPSDDWMNQFEKYAEDASSDRLQELWGRTLAGEIRKPGTFSLVTLQYISTIDSSIADLIDSVLPYVLNNRFIVINDDHSIFPDISTLIELEQIGFGNLSSGMLTTKAKSNVNNALWFYNCDNAMIIQFDTFQEIDIKSFILSIPGREISKLVSKKGDMDELAKLFWQFNPVKISTGAIIRHETQISMPTPKESTRPAGK